MPFADRARKKSTNLLLALQDPESALAFASWQCLVDRCCNPHSRMFRHYGGRGIFVCDEWLDFFCFFRDMGKRRKDLSIERINNDDGYYKENCIWADKKAQARNTRRNVRIQTPSGIMLQTDLAKSLGLAEGTILRRMQNNPENLMTARWFKRSKLNSDQVVRIKKMFAVGASDVDVAEASGISRQMAGSIRRGRYWADVSL